MIAILPIQPDILEMMAGDIGLEAEGPVWGYFAAEGTKMLGYIVVEKAEPVRIIALQCEDFVIADGLLRRALYPFYEEGSRGYTFACEVPMPLPMAYTRRERAALPPFLGQIAPETQGKTKKTSCLFPFGMLS